MFSDGLIPLIEKGIVTGEEKTLDKGKIAASFVMSCKKTYDFIDQNPEIQMMKIGYANDVENIRK